MIQIFKTLWNNTLGCLDIFSGKLKIPVCPSALQHLSSHRNHALFVYLFLIHRIAHKPKAAWPASAKPGSGASISGLTTHAHHTRAHSHVGVRVFYTSFTNRFGVTESDHTSIWKLYFITWAIFWKIDSDVWNWFRTVVRNVRYKWKKLVFNVFSSQFFLLNKYASWGVRESVGKYGGEGGRVGFFPRT